jgi:hypothetical protein
MKISLRLFACALGFAALAVTGALAQEEEPAAFSIQFVSQFDYPGTGNQTRPQKINSAGDIAGLFVDINGISHGFIRFGNGNFSPPIDDPNSPTPFTEGRGINDSRLVCGDYTDSAGAFEGFFFQSPNTFTNYDPFPTFTIVLGVNNVGDFCGSDIPTGGIQEAFLNIGGTLTEFSVPNATATLAYQLNRTNQSCGYYIDSAGVTHGYWRDTNGTIHAPIDPTGSTGTIVFGNNDKNLIVGRYSDAAGATHGFLFSPKNNRFLIYDQPGATFTSLNGINRNNTITGRYTDPNTGIDHGLILQVVRTGTGITLPLAPPSAPPAQTVPQRAVQTAPAY